MGPSRLTVQRFFCRNPDETCHTGLLNWSNRYAQLVRPILEDSEQIRSVCNPHTQVLLVCGRVLHQHIFLATLLETTQIMSSDISDNNIIMASLEEVLREIRKAFKEHKKHKNASDDEEFKMLLSRLKKDQQSVVTQFK
jgi:Mg2+ and Co2+ transporter CorA